MILFAALFLLADCADETAEPSSRRYLDMFEIERYVPHTDAQASLVTTRFRLLQRPEVQSDLALSPDQCLAVQTAYKTPWKQIPGLSDFIAEQKEKKGGLSEDERKSHNLESSRGISRITVDFHIQKLNQILTPQQSERLNQLVLQVHGPVLLLVQTNLPFALEIPPDQMEKIRTEVTKADREIVPALQKFGRGFISGYGPGESEETREREMKDLITRLRRMIIDRDEKILRTLSGDQRKKFHDLQGKPLQIQWSPRDLMEHPFEKEDS